MADEPINGEDSIEEGCFKKLPKNPRASARAKLRRRLTWLQGALHNTEMAIADVFNAPGRTYKKEKLEAIRNAIAVFREATGLTGDGLENIPELPDDFFDRVFSDPSWKSAAYEANTAPLRARPERVERLGHS